MQTQGMFQSI